MMKKLFLICALLYSGQALAAGYQLNEYSASNMGRSYAGMGVVGDDFSSIGYNPAGMVYNQTNGAQLVSSFVRLYSHFRGDDGYGKSGKGHTTIERFLPSGFTQYRLNDRATVGLGVYMPFGLATDYENDWFGNRHGVLSEIVVTDVSPALSYKITDYLAVGGAVNFQYADARLTSSNSDVKGKDWATGYTVGLAITPIKEFRIGLSYRSKISHKLRGGIKSLQAMTGYGPIDLHGDISAKITTPETAMLSLAWDVNEKWTLSGTARWTRWTRFENLDLLMDTQYGLKTSTTEEKWRNTGFYALGADYKATDKWTLRTGVGYDMSVIRSAAYRTPRIPDGRRVWTSLGTSYAFRNMQVDFGYAHIFVYGGHAKGTDKANAQYGNPNIKYSSNANMLSLGFQYKF